MKKLLLLALLFTPALALSDAGDIPLSSNFQLNSGRALDPRTVVADSTTRVGLGQLQTYNGMQVFERDNLHTYQLQGSTSNWVDLGILGMNTGGVSVYPATSTPSFPFSINASSGVFSSTVTVKALTLTGPGNFSFFNPSDNQTYQVMGSSTVIPAGHFTVIGASNSLVDGGTGTVSGGGGGGTPAGHAYDVQVDSNGIFGGYDNFQNNGTSITITAVSSFTETNVGVESWTAVDFEAEQGTINVNGALLLGGTAGTNGQVATSQGPGTVPHWATGSGGGGTPAGNPYDIQVDSNGVFGGYDNFQNNGSTITVTNVSSFTETNVSVESWTAVDFELKQGTASFNGTFLANGSAGTNGQVWTSGGSGTVPSWTTVSGGGGGSTIYPTTSTIITPFGINNSSAIAMQNGAQPLIQFPNAQDVLIGPISSAVTHSALFDTATGAGALNSGATGGFCTANGNSSLASDVGGAENSGLGYNSGGGVVDGNYGVYFGANSDPSNIHGSRIMAIGGVDACYFNTVDDTFCLGYFSGQPAGGTNQTTGSKNMLIGNLTGFPPGSAQLNNVIALGYSVQVGTSNVFQVGDTGGQANGAHMRMVVDSITVVSGNITGLTAGLPVQTDASKNLISAAISISTGIAGAPGNGDIVTSNGSGLTGTSNFQWWGSSVAQTSATGIFWRAIDTNAGNDIDYLLEMDMGGSIQGYFGNTNVLAGSGGPGFTFYDSSKNEFARFDTTNYRLSVGTNTPSGVNTANIEGNMEIGSGIYGIRAPANGLLVQAGVKASTAQITSLSTAAIVYADSVGNLTSNTNSVVTASSLTFTSPVQISTIVATGGIYVQPSPIIITSNYVASSTDAVILASAPTGGLSITLPSVKTSTGQVILITKVDNDTWTVTINTAQGDVIQGTGTHTMNNYTQACELRAIGLNIWEPIGQGCPDTQENVGPPMLNMSALALNASSDVVITTMYNPGPCMIKGYKIILGLTSAGNTYDLGVYSYAGSLIDHMGTTTIPAAGVLNLTHTGSTYNLLPQGNYYVGLTATGTTATWGGLSQQATGALGVLKFTQTTAGLPSSLTLSSGVQQTGAKGVPNVQIQCGASHTNGAIN